MFSKKKHFLIFEKKCANSNIFIKIIDDLKRKVYNS